MYSISKFSRLCTSIGLSLLPAIFLPISELSRAADEQLSEALTAALTVELVEVTAQEWSDRLELNGPIVAWQEAIIGAQVSGQRLDQILVNVGDKVSKGDVLARYDNSTLIVERAELEALWRQAESDYKRAVSLKNSAAMSPQQIESYSNQAAVAQARLNAKELQLRHATIVAPTNGTISARQAALGAISNINTELFRLIVDDRLEWRGEMSARHLHKAQPGQTVKLSLPNGDTAKAIVRQVSPTLASDSRLATVYADIETASTARAGMYARGKLMVEVRPALVIPTASTFILDGHNYVFTTDSTEGVSRVKRRAVELGQTNNQMVEVVSGLESGEYVVAQGAGFLNDNDLVRIVNAEKPHAPATIGTKTADDH